MKWTFVFSEQRSFDVKISLRTTIHYTQGNQSLSRSIMRWLSALLLVFLVTMAIVWPCQSAPAEGALRNQSNAKCKYFVLGNVIFFLLPMAWSFLIIFLLLNNSKSFSSMSLFISAPNSYYYCYLSEFYHFSNS